MIRKPKDPQEPSKSTRQRSKNSTSATEKGKTRSVLTRGLYDKDKAELTKEALVLLGVHPDDLENSPKIEHLLAPIGKAKIFEYLEGSEEPEARKILELKKRLNQKQALAVPFEAYCIAAVIPVKKMFGIIVSEVSDQEAKAKELIFRASHTEVLKATIESAMDPLGVSDRKMLHQAAGFVPVPKNSVTHIHGNQITDNSQQQVTNIAVLPPVEDVSRRIRDRFNEKATELIPAAPVLAITAAETEDDEDDQ